MQEVRISLYDLQDDDVIAVGDVVYKVEKIRGVFSSLIKQIYRDFSVCLCGLNAHRLGLCNPDHSMLEIYTGDFCGFEYLKIGDSKWKSGKVKIYLSAFLYSKQSDLIEQFEAVCYYPQYIFNDEDVVSFKRDCFCKIQSVKTAFKALTLHNTFRGKIINQAMASIPEFSSDLFQAGKECELLRKGNSKWEPMILGLQFTIDAIEDDAINEQTSILKNQDSPLDEIRKISEL